MLLLLFLQWVLLRRVAPRLSRWWIGGPLGIALVILGWQLAGTSTRFVTIRTLLEVLTTPVTLVRGGVGFALLATSVFLGLVALAQATVLGFEAARASRWLVCNLAGIGTVALVLVALRGLPATALAIAYGGNWPGSVARIALTVTLYGVFGAVTGGGLTWLLSRQPYPATTLLARNHSTTGA